MRVGDTDGAVVVRAVSLFVRAGVTVPIPRLA